MSPAVSILYLALEKHPQAELHPEIILRGLDRVLVNLGRPVVRNKSTQLVQRNVPAAHPVIHGQHFQRL